MKRIALLLAIAFATISPITSFARGANNPETTQAPTQKQKEKAKAKSVRQQRPVRRNDPKHYVNNKPRAGRNNFSQPKAKAKTTKPAPVMSAGKTQ